ncbi:carbohydrate ABC transporter permease [Lysinibacter sp. HNR]|uniref:carbohydrate ABC transporter permease n=1 Tax=Lysinibacter sp. HNR TaxID=3031408 RepID=UPI00243548B3|nr:carbohydrate ABC transporter permease [Lysinibacter sp. HNR]WGD38035.1 carbohydrate ABC transporter permease [Lysinibacter sp. HNR]
MKEATTDTVDAGVAKKGNEASRPIAQNLATLGRAKPSPAPARRRRHYGDDRASATRVSMRMLVGFVVILVFVAPYVIMVLGSLKSRSEILSVPPSFLPEEWRFDNYITMWSTPETPLVQNLISTIVISVCATLLVLLVALPAAYYTARFRFPGRLVFLFLVITTQMLQPAVLATGLFRQFNTVGLNDTWLAMILVNAAFNLSFATWIMHSFFAGVPRGIEEAAQLDGAGKMRVLFQVNLPLVWPGIVTAIIFTFVASWNEFAASLVILSTAGNQPLSVALTKFVGQYDSAWQYVFGASVVAIVPVVILFILIEKRLVGGLAAGAVK